MEGLTDFTSVPVIVALCIFIAQGYKSIFKETTYRYIPIVCAVCGMVLGVVCFYTCPGYIPAENWLVAAATGIVSGLTATGAHQVIKQNTSSNGS